MTAEREPEGREPERQPPPARSPYGGLCAECTHARTIRSDRGSVFVLCELARTDPSFARYPPQPVVRCPGFRR